MDLSKYLASQPIQDKRMSICQECDFYIASTERCSKCSCFMPWKVKIAFFTCPDHKWLHETIN